MWLPGRRLWVERDAAPLAHAPRGSDDDVNATSLTFIRRAGPGVFWCLCCSTKSQRPHQGFLLQETEDEQRGNSERGRPGVLPAFLPSCLGWKSIFNDSIMIDS